MQISKHLTLQELTYSETAIKLGISNEPTQAQIANMKLLADEVFEPAREHFAVPIHISSGFRIHNLNVAIGGASTSQHCGGQAIDIDMKDSKVTNAILFHWIKDNLKYDQLIWEFGDKKNPDWLHVSYTSGKNRQQTLRAVKTKGKTNYENF